MYRPRGASAAPRLPPEWEQQQSSLPLADQMVATKDAVGWTVGDHSSK